MNIEFSLRRIFRLLWVVLPILLASLVVLLVMAGVSSAASADLPQKTSVVHDQAVADVTSQITTQTSGDVSSQVITPTIAGIISQVTTQTLAYELAGLTGERPVTVAGSLYTITTRHSYQEEAISMTTRYVYEQFAGLGLAVTYHDYVLNAHQVRNVVAEKPGLVDADEIYLITAHVDAMPEGTLAPGADDNGSGSVAVLMAARLLASHHFAYTIRFVLFTGEEQGMLGSADYAADCKVGGENIQGVVNLDMIAYNSDTHPEPAIELHAYSGVPASLELTRLFSDVVGVYGLDLVPARFVDGWALQRSDQWSFLQLGYPAFLVIEDSGDLTPYYHTTGDRLSTLDLDYYAESARAAIATIAHMGRLLPGSALGQLSGTVYDLDTGRPLSGATVAAFWTEYPYTFTTPTDASGVYSLSLPAGGYTMTVWPGSPAYHSATVTQVLVITDTVTVRDVALEPWSHWYLPWVVWEP